MRILCHPVTKASKYIRLIFDGIEDRYQRLHREDGHLMTAVGWLEAGEAVLVHVHWEEFVLSRCVSEEDADLATKRFRHHLSRVAGAGGRIVWTVHNELPHLVRFHRQFLEIRALLAVRADAVIVHNLASIDTLAGQIAIDRGKVRIIPHPSYLGHYEDAAALAAGAHGPHERIIQGFGAMRLQKGFGEMVGMLPAPFLAARNARIRVSGRGIEAAAIIGEHPARGDVHWDIRYVPDAETPALLRAAACVVLPYERLLTSGVALLAMSVGALLVAVDVPQLRELLPPESRRFLYPRGDAEAFRAVVDDVLGLSTEDRRAVVAANLRVAHDLHPRAIAVRLAALYDHVAAHGCPPREAAA